MCIFVYMLSIHDVQTAPTLSAQVTQRWAEINEDDDISGRHNVVFKYGSALATYQSLIFIVVVVSVNFKACPLGQERKNKSILQIDFQTF